MGALPAGWTKEAPASIPSSVRQVRHLDDSQALPSGWTKHDHPYFTKPCVNAACPFKREHAGMMNIRDPQRGDDKRCDKCRGTAKSRIPRTYYLHTDTDKTQWE